MTVVFVSSSFRVVPKLKISFCLSLLHHLTRPEITIIRTADTNEVLSFAFISASSDNDSSKKSFKIGQFRFERFLSKNHLWWRYGTEKSFVRSNPLTNHCHLSRLWMWGSIAVPMHHWYTLCVHWIAITYFRRHDGAWTWTLQTNTSFSNPRQSKQHAVRPRRDGGGGDVALGVGDECLLWNFMWASLLRIIMWYFVVYPRLHSTHNLQTLMLSWTYAPCHPKLIPHSPSVHPYNCACCWPLSRFPASL